MNGPGFPVVKSEMVRRCDKPYKCIVCDVTYAASAELDDHLTSDEHIKASFNVGRKIGDEPATVCLFLRIKLL